MDTWARSTVSSMHRFCAQGPGFKPGLFIKARNVPRYMIFIQSIHHFCIFHMTFIIDVPNLRDLQVQVSCIYLVYTMCIPGIYQVYDIYMINIWYIPGVSQIYTRHIHETFTYTKYIPGIYMECTRWLVLRRWTWPHSCCFTVDDCPLSAQMTLCQQRASGTDQTSVVDKSKKSDEAKK